MTAVQHAPRAHPITGVISDGLLLLYKRALSPLLHAAIGSTGACRFQPSCSEYAAIAVHARGPVRGLALAAWRVLRCQPLSRGGFDPVPGTWPPSSIWQASATWPPSGSWATGKVPPGLVQEEAVGSSEGHNQAVHLP